MAIVGDTAKARKGTSWGHVRRLMSVADVEWTANRIFSGLSSGEGLIWQVRGRTSGIEMDLDATCINNLKQGNIVRQQWYFDHAQALEAVGAGRVTRGVDCKSPA